MTMNTFSFSMDRSCLAVTAAMLVLLLCIKPGYADDVEFRWAILADSSDGMQSLDFSGSPIVFSGTALQIYIEHLNNCHIYLYLLDSNDEMTPLYPSESGYYDYGFPRGPKLVPPGEQSFMFVPPAGSETLLLIASVERLFQLEELTSIFLANPDSLGQQKLLLDRINELIKDGDEKKSKKAERLKEVTITYTSDNGIQEREFVATEVDTRAFYGRILLIDHR